MDLGGGIVSDLNFEEKEREREREEETVRCNTATGLTGCRVDLGRGSPLCSRESPRVRVISNCWGRNRRERKVCLATVEVPVGGFLPEPGPGARSDPYP